MGEEFGKEYKGKDLNIEKNRYDVDIELGGWEIQMLGV